MSLQQCRVLLVDDHPHAKLAMRTLLRADQRFIIANESRSGEEALQKVAAESFDLVLMDIRLPGMDGLQATRLIKTTQPLLKVIVVSVSDDPRDLYAALQAGAQGYLIKNIEPSGWLSYLRAIVFDEGELPEDISLKMMDSFRSPQDELSLVNGEELMPLQFTSREFEILDAVARGLSNREIAQELYISEHTVKNHMKSMMQKANVDNRVKLAALSSKMTRKSHGNP